jgi:hypothetical protein
MGVGCGPGGCPGGMGCVMSDAFGCETHASATVARDAGAARICGVAGDDT